MAGYLFTLMRTLSCDTPADLVAEVAENQWHPDQSNKMGAGSTVLV